MLFNQIIWQQLFRVINKYKFIENISLNSIDILVFDNNISNILNNNIIPYKYYYIVLNDSRINIINNNNVTKNKYIDMAWGDNYNCNTYWESGYDKKIKKFYYYLKNSLYFLAISSKYLIKLPGIYYVIIYLKFGNNFPNIFLNININLENLTLYTKQIKKNDFNNNNNNNNEWIILKSDQITINNYNQSIKIELFEKNDSYAKYDIYISDIYVLPINYDV